MYPQVFGKYVLERELSRGGMARVVLATLRGAGGFEKKLVVKQIRDELAFDQQFVRRFVEEAKTTVALSHPNIVPVYELGVEQGTYFLAMELVEGVSVAELLRERNQDGSRRVVTPEEGAYIGVEVCRALDYAHRRMKVVHRDITPRNVMIDEEGQIKLIDFGIAAPALVAGHEILGSPGHMAPEQVDGGQLGPPTDIFAVAVLLMEAWTGSAPFRRATPEECAAAVREKHPKPSEFDPRLLPLDDAIGRAMNVDPRKRQQEASDLARALRAFLQEIDADDVARTLGERVRDLREEAESPSPPSRSTAPRASAASHGDLGTKTFAARDEVSWSGPPPTDDGSSSSSAASSTTPVHYEKAKPFDPADAPSTRKLSSESSSKLPASSVSSSASRPARGRRDDPAMAIPTPLMVDVEDLERIHGDIAAARAERRGSDGPKTPQQMTPQQLQPQKVEAKERDRERDKGKERDKERGEKEKDEPKRQADIPTLRRSKFPRPNRDDGAQLETIATRPLETPVRSYEPPLAQKTGRRGRSIAIFAAVVAIAGGAGFAVWRVKTAAKTDAVHPPSTITAPPSTTSPPSATQTESVSAPIVPPPPSSSSNPKSTGAPTIPLSPSGGPPIPALSSSAPLAQGRAAVMLLGEPGTRVSIDGASKGPCPLRVDLTPGPHDVRFTFDPTGESRGERFTVKSGEHVTVRAEFTGATPTIKIQR